MKQLLITIVAVVLVGCGESQQSAPAPEVKLVEPSEPVAEAAKPKPPTAKAPDISIHRAAMNGNIEAVKRHLADGADVNAKDFQSKSPLDYANAIQKYDSPEVEAPIKEIATIIEIDDLLRKHGGKRGEELKAEGK